MERKVLGKIKRAEFGLDRDRPFLYGLDLTFSMELGGVGSGGRYLVNVSDGCKWESGQDKNSVLVEYSVTKVKNILEQAKVNYVSQLKDKPVEITLEDNTFKDFRILTEVL